MDITLLYGTETGNAEMLCEELEDHLGTNHNVETFNLKDVDPQTLDLTRLYLIVCSTYGDGELPASAQPFAQALAASPPDFSAMRFGIFGLGDSQYETYNQGSEALAALLSEHGARQVGPRALHDASGGELPEDLALPWADARVAEALAEA